MKTEMVLLDLDDTLLDNKKQVSEKNRKILWELSDAGIRIGYVTSRTPRKINKLISGLPCDCVALLDGAEIWYYSPSGISSEGSSIRKKEVSCFGIEGSIAIAILDSLLNKYHELIVGYFGEYSVVNTKVMKDDRDVGNYTDYKEMLSKTVCQRIRVYARHLDSFERFPEIVVNYVDNDTIIQAVSVNKKSAVEYLCERFKISPQNVIAFGDSEYDIPMLEAVGTGVAVANASEKVKKSADEITGSNVESGIGEYLQKKIGLKPHIHSDSMKEDRCIFLFTDLRGRVPIISAEEKQKRICAGISAHSFLAEDPVIAPEIVDLFVQESENSSDRIARIIGELAEKLFIDTNGDLVLVSLARGGIMTGSLCKRYIERYYNISIPHYAISLVRNVGIDESALSDIVNRHGDNGIRFVDGWTGSGLISTELERCINMYNDKYGTTISASLCVLADTSHVCMISGTREDVFLPECCLNGEICGLLSSISLYGVSVSDEYHGAFILDDKTNEDYTEWYYDMICSRMNKVSVGKLYDEPEYYGKQIQERICKELSLDSSHRVRLGLGESTRAIFRYRINELLVNNLRDTNNKYIIQLATTKGIRIKEYNTGKFNCISILEK